MAKRKQYEVKEGGKFGGSLLTKMRKIAFHDMRVAAGLTMKHAERMRDDEALLAAAEEKRMRKLKKRAK